MRERACADLLHRLERDLELPAALGVSGIDDEQEERRFVYLVESLVERSEQRMREPLDEPDGVGDEDRR